MASLNVSTGEYNDTDTAKNEDSANYRVIKKQELCRLRPSALSVYIVNILYWSTVSINIVAVDAVLSNKLCYVKFKDNTLCTNTTFTSNHPRIQQEVATWGNYDALVQMPFAILVSQMLSFYCGNVGHKLPLLLPMCSNFLGTLYLALLATPQFIDWHMSSIFGYSILYSMLGSKVLVQIAGFSYVALISPKEKRVSSMAFCEGTVLVGILIGSLVNGPIIDSTSVSTLMYINAGFTLLPMIIVLVFLTDISSAAVSLDNYKWKDVIGINRIADAFRCIGKKREGNRRLLLILGLILYTSPYIAAHAYSQLSYLYFVQQKGMSMTQYSIYQGYVYTLKGFFYPGLLSVVKKRFKIDDFHLFMASTAISAFGFIVLSITAFPYGDWIGGGLIGAYIVFFGLSYAFLTSLCERTELGNLFAFIGVIKLVLGTLFSVVFKELYSATLFIWPALFLAVCALLFIIGMLLTSVIDRWRALK